MTRKSKKKIKPLKILYEGFWADFFNINYPSHQVFGI